MNQLEMDELVRNGVRFVENKFYKKEQSTKTIRKRKNKIFELDPTRALEIMNKIEYLSEIGKCNLKHAVLCGISNEEWLKTQHFFLANSAKYRPIIIEELKNRISGSILTQEV